MNNLSDDEAAIRAVEERFTDAFNAGDIDAIMKTMSRIKASSFLTWFHERTIPAPTHIVRIGWISLLTLKEGQGSTSLILVSRWRATSRSVIVSSMSQAPTKKISPLIVGCALPMGIERSATSG